MRKILLLDVSSLSYRAFFALPFMASIDGIPTNALYGFVNMYNAALRNIRPNVVVACFDSKEETFRRGLYEDYKAQRREMPDDFYKQLPFIEEFLRISGAMCVAMPGYEADDIIASFCAGAEGGDEYYILSSDKDLMQLVDKDKKVFFCSYKGGKLDVFSTEEVFGKFGVWPGQMVDYLSLLGDSSDNIKGVKGIGKKTARRLLSSYGSVDGILRNINEVSPKRIAEALRQSKGLIERNKTLIALKTDLPVPGPLRETSPDTDLLRRFYKRFGFRSLLQKLDLNAENSAFEKGAYWLSGDMLSVFSNKELALGKWKGEFFACDGKNAYSLGLRVLKDIFKEPSIVKIVADEGDWLDALDLGQINGEVIPALVLFDLCSNGNKSFPPERCDEIFGELRRCEDSLPEEAARFFKEVDIPLFLILAHMRQAGVKVDRGLLSRLLKELSEGQSKIVANIYEEVGFEFNLNSPKQLADVLFNKLNLPVIKKGRSHPSTSEEVLRKLAPLSFVVDEILKYRQLNKLITAYLKPLLSSSQKDGKIHCRFSQIKTQTGRLTAVDPNLQTIPVRSKWGKELRRAFVSRFLNGYIVSADYSQIELRVLAHISRDAGLLEAFNNGLDVHRQTAARILDKDIDDVSEEDRDLAKRVNFGIIYGISAYGLAEETGLPPDMARSFIEKYFNRFSGVREFIDKTIAKAKIDGFVTTMFGRRRFLPELSSKVHSVVEFGKRAAVNTVVQGTAAEIIKIAMVKVYDFLNEDMLLVLQIHDELLLDVKEDALRKAREIVKREMESAVKLDVPLIVDVKAGPNWLDVKDL